MRVRVNEDADLVAEIRQKLIENDGYCPCMLTKTKDTKCMCKDFRENVPAGEECHCGLYVKVEQ